MTSVIPEASTTTPDPRAQRDGVDLDALIAALPEAVDKSMRKTWPDEYTPELAARFAETMTAALRAQAAGRPLTAAERGSRWMLRWGCNPQCTTDHTTDPAPEWHLTAPVETKLRDADIDSSGYSENGENLPWLGAQVFVNSDKPQAYGRETRVWLHYGIHTAEMSPARAREALEAMRGFVTGLESVVKQAEEIAEGDFEGDPEIARLDSEATDRRIKRVTEARA